ncbi:MAG: FtsX-like permease family protein [Bacillota bacterium]|nr:FtsX-like permease family protein [Bacillota bacterium]
MGVLTKKLRRTIWLTRGPFLAVVAVVMVGISVYIAMATSYYNLNRSQAMFYRETLFADYYFQVIKAPSQVIKQIESVPGVSKATGRIQKDLPLLKEKNQRGTVRLISYPLPMEREVNRLQLLSGRLFNKYPQGGGVEVLTDPLFFQSNNLAANAAITIVAEGRRIPLTVVGTATSPELVYPMKDAATLITDPKTFGIVMMPQNQAQQILNLTGQINQVVLTLAPGAEEDKVKEQVEAILKPYGNLAAYPREQQLSHAVLQSKIDGLQASSRFLPAIFLGIAAAIQLVMLGRMIKSHRLQIGVMKALGYSNLQIMAHYTGYALTVALAGALLGSLLGLLLATAISKTYAMYFNLPAAIGGVNLQAILYGFLISLTVGVLAGVTASRAVTKIQPAESMRPEPPKQGGRILLEHWSWLWRKLDANWRMSLRTVFRNRGRFGLTLVGVVFAVGMLVVALFARDSIDYMLKEHFYKQQRYDYSIRFANPVKEQELLNISRLAGEEKLNEMTGIASEKESALGITQRRVPVIISLEETAHLKPGYEVQVAIETGRATKVPLVPLEAVRTGADGQKQVMEVVDGRVKHRTVKTGLSDRDNIEILSGLTPGSVIVRDGSLELKENTKVQELTK